MAGFRSPTATSWFLVATAPIGTSTKRFGSQRQADVESGVAAAVVREVVRQMNQDIPIWEHKRYLAAPMLCDGDGPIAEYRRWARQFSA